MPYVNIRIAGTLSREQKAKIAEEIFIPNKSNLVGKSWGWAKSVYEVHPRKLGSKSI